MDLHTLSSLESSKILIHILRFMHKLKFYQKYRYIPESTLSRTKVTQIFSLKRGSAVQTGFAYSLSRSYPVQVIMEWILDAVASPAARS